MTQSSSTKSFFGEGSNIRNGETIGIGREIFDSNFLKVHWILNISEVIRHENG